VKPGAPYAGDGGGVPVNFLRELDVKIDAGIRDAGVLWVAVEAGQGPYLALSVRADRTAMKMAKSRSVVMPKDCNAVFLY
jgi:hypothetical protein